MKTNRFHAATCEYILLSVSVCTVLLATGLAGAQQDHLAVENPGFEQAGDQVLPAADMVDLHYPHMPASRGQTLFGLFSDDLDAVVGYPIPN